MHLDFQGGDVLPTRIREKNEALLLYPSVQNWEML